MIAIEETIAAPITQIVALLPTDGRSAMTAAVGDWNSSTVWVVVTDMVQTPWLAIKWRFC
jgi:hypothetical protein